MVKRVLLCGETNEIGGAYSERKEEPTKCINTEELAAAVCQMKNGKASDTSDVVAEMMQALEDTDV